MPVNPREMIISAGRRFPVRIRIAVPPDGRGRRHPQNTAWHDENCSADGWAMTPAGTRGVLNDALSMYFSGMQHWRAHSSPGGALGRRSRRVAACFRCARTSRSRGAGLHRSAVASVAQREVGVLTKEILFGMNILTLAGFVV